jgi:catechol 2,3-dioxygenase-like lactoylglutathione lyase family enzyme
MARPRGIDHLVIAVRDFDAARAAYQHLGFTLTPEARHPFGTKNSLAQLQGNFLELVAVADPTQILEPTASFFSFAAFNRDFLEKQEGLSMLALKSRDPNLDMAAFASRGLPVYDPVRFERIARGPDGSERAVAFTMTFTGDPRIKDAAFFTCTHHYPENFWRREFQSHANGTLRIDAVTIIARDPTDFHEYFTYFTGEHDMRSTSLGVEIDTGDGSVDILSPVGFHGFFGNAAAIEADPKPRLVACRMAVGDLGATEGLLRRNQVPHARHADQLVVPASAACGAAIAFIQG